MADGASLQLAARAFSCDGSQLALPPVQWSSADATTVSVSATGMALGLKLGGPVAVTAVAQGKQGSAQLTVVPRVVSTVTVEPATGDGRGGAHQHPGGEGVRRAGAGTARTHRHVEQRQ